MTLQEFIARLRSYVPTGKRAQACTPPLAQPARDWQLLLVAASLLFIAAAAFAGFAYTQGTPEQSGGAPAVHVAPSVDEAVFSQVLEKIQERAQRHSQVRAQ